VDFFASLGVDGLRLDMTAELPLDLGREIRKRFRAKVPGAFVYGEVVPEHAFRFRGEGVVCASTDFGFFEAVSRVFGRGQGTLRELCEVVRRGELVRGGCPRSEHVRFVSTHDHPRLATVAAAHALLFTLPGIPMLLYGEELGLRARDPKEAALAEVEDVWLDRVPMPWDGVGREPERTEALKRLILARREHAALRQGTLEWLHVEDELLVFRRAFAGEAIDVVLSVANDAREVDIEDDHLPTAELVAASEGVSGEGSTFVVPPCGYLVARRSSSRARGRLTPRTRANLMLVDDDMAHARTFARSRPTRLDFAVTEACNLRCIHCITHAPRLTQEKKAKTLTEPTLDALREDLAFARYFGFVHGGESLVTPMLRRTLEAIAEARGEEPYVVHLLSNGLLATTEAVRPLVALGLSSLSVSLDGATAETNDAIRLGGRFETIVRNVRELVRMRRDEHLDLRLGLSFVMLRENLHETVSFVELAADLGVDWVKLEELVPQDDRTKRSLLRDAEALKQRVIRAQERGRELGVRVVDHTVERRIFVCDMDGETRAFLEDDAFANRAELLPCRTPWETACIEPDGTVKLGDFFGPSLGRLGSEGRNLEELWNRDEAREARERSVCARRCGRGPAICVQGARTS
jgi:MoaA/NifB/PqqE/SkfB family radical SAM enzyme